MLASLHRGDTCGEAALVVRGREGRRERGSGRVACRRGEGKTSVRPLPLRSGFVLSACNLTQWGTEGVSPTRQHHIALPSPTRRYQASPPCRQGNSISHADVVVDSPGAALLSLCQADFLRALKEILGLRHQVRVWCREGGIGEHLAE